MAQRCFSAAASQERRYAPDAAGSRRLPCRQRLIACQRSSMFDADVAERCLSLQTSPRRRASNGAPPPFHVNIFSIISPTRRRHL
jgi:hypothetical protein